MLQAQVPALGITSHALNDVVVGRASAGKPVYMDISIDRSRLALYRCDAVIVASATGSTAYSLSAGGPILHPESREMLLTPVAPHLAAGRSLVLPSFAEIDLVVDGEFGAVVSIDGQVDRPLARGDRISVCRSPHLARFVRMAGREDHYATLGQQLDWLRAVDASKQTELFGLTEAETR